MDLTLGLLYAQLSQLQGRILTLLASSFLARHTHATTSEALILSSTSHKEEGWPKAPRKDRRFFQPFNSFSPLIFFNPLLAKSTRDLAKKTVQSIPTVSVDGTFRRVEETALQGGQCLPNFPRVATPFRKTAKG